MSLREKQTEFVKNTVKLFNKIFADGHEATYGEAWRPPETAEIYAKKGIGIKDSLHCQRLAIDINLFKNGAYLADTSYHKPFGEFWKSLNPDNRWGGDFSKPDGNHYEMRS